MTTYALTVSTNDLGLGVLSGARVVVERKRTQISDIFSGQALIKNTSATNTSGIAVMFLSPDDSSVYHELKIFDLAGIPVYSVVFTMPPQAVSLVDLPVQDIVSASAAAALESVATATAQAVISTDQAGIATAQAGIATAQAVISTDQAGIATAQAADALSSAAAAAASATNALTYKTAAETARDAAIIGAGVYTTEAAGRAAVADGVAFKVQGSGDVAAYEYRRINSGESALIATYPSVSSLSSKVATIVVSKNLVNSATVQVGKTVHTDGTLLSIGSFSASDYIAVTPLTTYTKTASTGAWAEYDANKTFISYTNLTATITTGATTAFIRASILTGASFDVQKGGVLGDADTYATKLLVTNQYLDSSIVKPAITLNNKLDPSILVSAKQASFMTRTSVNLFDANSCSASTILSCATVNSVLYATTKTNTYWFTSDLIPVAASTEYTFSKFGVWVQYDVNMNVVAYNTTALYVLSTITTHASAAFIRISYPYAGVDAATTMFCLASKYPSIYAPYSRYVLSSDVSPDNAWRDKKILWLGTSIPTGGGYPENVSSNLSATLNKQSIGGGRARARKSDGGWFVQSEFIYLFTLSKADINARYGSNLGLNVSASDYLTLSGGGPVLTQGMLDALTASNYEVRLVPYIAESSLFILDYGINDRNGQLPTISVPFLTCEQLLDAGDLYNRNEFLGAMNFLIKTIQDAKAALSDKNYRIVIINHHNKGATASSERNVVTAQENLAKYWGFPLINVADNMGVNPSTLASLTSSGDGLHFVTGSNLEKRYTRYITAKLREIDV